MSDLRAWAIEWHSVNRLDGDRRDLTWEPFPDHHFHLFRTRREARAFIEERFGYMRDRDDLKREPHGWRWPQAVRVTVNRE
jgi:hypothetical protein